jgi:hypothetical protein
MTFQQLTKEQANGCGCSFEEWDKEKRRMAPYGKQAVATMSGGKYLCIEHLPDALIRCGNAALLGPKMKRATLKSYFSKEDFLIACKEP